MDMFIKVLDVLTTSIDCILLGYCRCVSHCFRFIQLLGATVEYIIGFITTVLKYNRFFFSSFVNFISNAVTFVQEIPQKIVTMMEFIFYDIIIGVPMETINYIVENIMYRITNFNSNLHGYINSMTTYCQVVFPLIGNTFMDLFANFYDVPYKLLSHLVVPVQYCFDGSKLILQSILFWLLDVILWYVKGLKFIFQSIIVMLPETLLRICTAIVYCLEFIRDTFINSMLETYESITYGSKISGSYTSIFHYCFLKLTNIFSSLSTLFYIPGLIIVFLYENIIYVYKCTGSIVNTVLSKCWSWLVTMVTMDFESLSTVFLLILSTLLTYILYFQYPVVLDFMFWCKQSIINLFQPITLYFTGDNHDVNHDGINHSNSDFEEDNTKSCCIVCQDNQKSVVLMPCRHLCLCTVCCQKIFYMRISKRLCPLCRVKIDNFISVYI